MSGLTIQERYSATISQSVVITNTETGKKSHILMLISNTTWKVWLLLENNLIEFSTPSGNKEKWIDWWWLLHGSSLLLIDDWMTHSLWLYRLDGTPASLEFTSKFNTIEKVFRIEKCVISRVRGNAFLLDPAIQSMVNMPAYWPE
jgi:hypothetical protein